MAPTQKISGTFGQESYEQCLVASVGNNGPEVYFVSYNPSEGAVTMVETAMGPTDTQVKFGTPHRVALTDVAFVVATDRIVSALAQDGSTLVQMHLENKDDERRWEEILNLKVGKFGSDGATRETSATQQACGQVQVASEDVAADECQALHARSRQLQERVQFLEAVGKRRDVQLAKMMSRLDGAMQMLAAVQEMCGQQRVVISTQCQVIEDLRGECGEGADDAVVRQVAASGVDSGRIDGGDACALTGVKGSASASLSGSSSPAIEDAEQDMAGKAGKMLALLKQADEMQHMLQQLESFAASTTPSAGLSALLSPKVPACAVHRPVMPPPSPTTHAVDEEFDEEEEGDDGEEYDEGEDSDAEGLIARLQALEAEKERYESMLNSSHREHSEMVERLGGMRSLMSALGMNTDHMDDASDGSTYM
uniref:Uncharacterized protein n=1 Tax=Noctiluca scintillans TaxID=2966 RepID=A0A7S0ZNX0_NOCSC